MHLNVVYNDRLRVQNPRAPTHPKIPGVACKSGEGSCEARKKIRIFFSVSPHSLAKSFGDNYRIKNSNGSTFRDNSLRTFRGKG